MYIAPVITLINLIYMKKILSISFLFLAFTAYAQSDNGTFTHTLSVAIPSVALVDVEGGNISAAFAVTGSEAGLPITAPADNNSTWLNYSAIKTGSTLKQVKVKVDKLLPGVAIKVTAGADAGNGGGKMGTAVNGGVNLTTTAQPLVTDIGSSYTGTGTTNGHNLTYSFTLGAASTYKDLEHKAHSVTVTYTIENK